ncbi:MAG TPA: LuxR C-terminal-related transcriptional regulator [Symbiobacteriaceae bacterium]
MTVSPALSCRAHTLLPLISSICSTLHVDELQKRYFQAVRDAIPARGLAFYLLDPETHRPRKTAVTGADDGFMTLYEERGRAVDPLHDRVLRTLQPAHSALLFSVEEWRRHPIYEVFGVAQLDYVLEAPVLSNGRLVATIGFSRRLGETPFDENDLVCAQTISHFVAVALANASRHSELGDQYDALRLALDLIDQAVVIADRTGQVQFANAAVEEVLPGDPSHRALPALIRAGMGKAVRPGSKGKTCVGEVSQGELALRLHTSEHRRDLVIGFLYGNGQGDEFSSLEGLLTHREVEVLELVDRGLKNKEIAKALYVSPHTVKSHLESAFRKLQARSKTELVARAHQIARGKPVPLC